MKISLDSLTVLDAIDRRASYAAAAEELHRVPSAVTYSVSKLEQDLGVTLFDRSGHRAVLTAAGRELLDEGRHLLRAAAGLENRIKRVATGWEAELHIAIGDLINLEAVYELVQQFFDEEAGTRIRLIEEVYGGTWDALVSGRADLVIGAPGEGPPGGGYATSQIGRVDFVFAMTPDHPLASLPEPLKPSDILAYRSVSAADSSRNLPPRTSGLLSGQEVLTVNDMLAKYQAQLMGLGVGFLPRTWIATDVAAGRLVTREVEENKETAMSVVAWRSDHVGRALRWFLDHLQDETWRARLVAAPWPNKRYSGAI
jgi:DNA-binding transcriptional LysR family regulator